MYQIFLMDDELLIRQSIRNVIESYRALMRCAVGVKGYDGYILSWLKAGLLVATVFPVLLIAGLVVLKKWVKTTK